MYLISVDNKQFLIEATQKDEQFEISGTTIGIYPTHKNQKDKYVMDYQKPRFVETFHRMSRTNFEKILEAI